MEGMNSGHMPGMNGTPPPNHQEMMMMHMTFFWGTQSEIFFSGWPGTRPGMYAIAILLVFVLCVLVDSHCRLLYLVKPGATAGVLRSLLHALRMGLAYLAMLALMSFNGGVFLATVAGHAVGFLAFGRQEEAHRLHAEKAIADRPSMGC